MIAEDAPVAASPRNDSHTKDLEEIRTLLKSEEAARRLADAGITQEAAMARVEKMTPAEVHYLAQRMREDRQAGGDGLGLLVVLLVIILLVVLIVVLLDKKVEVKDKGSHNLEGRADRSRWRAARCSDDWDHAPDRGAGSRRPPVAPRRPRDRGGGLPLPSAAERGARVDRARRGPGARDTWCSIHRAGTPRLRPRGARVGPPVRGGGGAPEQIEAEELVPDSLGTATYELALASRRAGFFSRDMRFVCAADPSPMRRLIALLDAGLPVVVLVKRGFPLFARYHYVAVTGYDDTRGLVLYQDGLEPDAVDDYESFQDEWHGGGHWALVVFPPDRDFDFLTADDRLELAQLCESREMWEAAEHHYSSVLAERPADRGQRWGGLALSHLRRGEEATAAYERALESDPNDPRALNNYASTSSGRGRSREGRGDGAARPRPRLTARALRRGYARPDPRRARRSRRRPLRVRGGDGRVRGESGDLRERIRRRFDACGKPL